MGGVEEPLLWALGMLFSLLVAGTVLRFVALRHAPADVVTSRLQSLRTWWILAILISLSVVCGNYGVMLLMLLAGLLSLREFLRLPGWRHVGRGTCVLLTALAGLYYGAVTFGQSAWLRSASPVVFLVSVGAVRSLHGQTDGYIRTTASLFWGLMLFVYCLSHACFVLELSPSDRPDAGAVGWFLYLVILTEADDIMQAITGRRFGRTKITPRVSPNKSLEGLLGGIAATVVLSVISAPWLTTFMIRRSFAAGAACSIAAGLLISMFGFLGDINMSAVKRDAGVKDGSQLLPGMGGMIDRIDSLTFTAPMFYYFVQAVA